MKAAYAQLQKEKEATCERRGFYLVKGESRYFISEKVDERALQRVCDSVLSDAKGWDYWIDYSMGLDISRRVAWANIDQTDRFV